MSVAICTKPDPAKGLNRHAKAAYRGIHKYTDFRHEPEDTLPTYIGDMLANILHLCRAKDIEFEDCLDRGRRHFDAENEVSQ